MYWPQDALENFHALGVDTPGAGGAGGSTGHWEPGPFQVMLPCFLEAIPE